MNFDCMTNRFVALRVIRQEDDAIIADFRKVCRARECPRRVIDRVNIVRNAAERKLTSVRDCARRIGNVPIRLVHRGQRHPVVALYIIAADRRTLDGEIVRDDSRVFRGDALG